MILLYTSKAETEQKREKFCEKLTATQNEWRKEKKERKFLNKQNLIFVFRFFLYFITKQKS